MNQADILAEKVLDDILEETVLEMQRWVILCNHMKEEHLLTRKLRSGLCFSLSFIFL